MSEQNTTNEFLGLEEKIVAALKTVFDPEIPVDVYNLGMIYKVEVADDNVVNIDMTLTAPGCPAADFLVSDVKMKVEGVEGVTLCNVNLVFDPVWDNSMMSEEAKLELGLM